MKNSLIILLSAAVVFLIALRVRQPEAPSAVPAPAPEPAPPVAAATPTPGPVALPSAAPEVEAPSAEAAVLAWALLDASVAGDFDAFKRMAAARGDERMRMVMTDPATEETFRRASAVVGPVCKDGYEMHPLGSLVQTGHTIYLWRLQPGMGADEFLVRLTLKGDQLAGFFFQ